MSGILGSLLGGSSQQQSSNVIGDILQQVLTQSGGVSGLISRFQDSGFGDHVQSWIGGDHLPISGNHIGQVFTPEEIEGWAAQAGIDPAKMQTVLAEALPHAIDHATPNGEVPAQGSTPDFSSLIGRFFGGAAAILAILVMSTGVFADESVAGRWKADLGSHLSIMMNVTPDGKWDSVTAKGDDTIAKMSGTYDQQTASPTAGMIVFTPTKSAVTTQHPAAEVEHDRYQITNDGNQLRLTSGGDTMLFHKQQ